MVLEQTAVRLELPQLLSGITVWHAWGRGTGMIPNELKVGGVTLRVERQQGLAASRKSFAEYSPLMQTIAIEPTIPQDHQEECLVHEIIEALDGFYGLELQHWQIHTLGFALYQVLKDNGLGFVGRGE
jgi:hypothetical protein